MATRRDSTVTDLDELRDQAQSSRSSYEPTWYTNLAYYQGHQWVFWRGGRLFRPQLEPWRVTFTDNRIVGIVRTEVAKLTKQRPTWVCAPRTGDSEDVDAARLAENLVEYLWEELDCSEKHRRALLWSRVCGAGFWKITWDKEAGDTTEILHTADGSQLQQDGRPIHSGMSQYQAAAQLPGVEPKTVSQGDICVEVRSPFQMFVDPLAGEAGLENAEWLIEESVQSPEYVLQRFNKDIEPDAQAISGLAEDRTISGTEPTTGAGKYKGIRVREYWCEPCSTHAKGRRAVWAGDQLLYEGDNEYGDMPYVMFTGVPVPGRFWPTSVTEQIRPLQTELNKTRSQIRENAARIGNPSLVVSKYADIKWEGLPGEKLTYDPSMPDSAPHYLQPPEMPAYIREELERMENSLREVSGQHEVSSATVPTGVTAASAINLLMEQDDTRLGPDVAAMEDTLAEAGEMILDLAAEYYDDPRMVRIGGEEGAWDIFEFKKTQLREHTHIDVQAGSALPHSKAARQAAMTDVLNLFIQYGVPVKEQDLRKFFRDFDVGGLERLFSDIGADTNQINRENQLMAMGEQLQINSFDNDQSHIEGHEDFQKSARYARMIANNPDIGQEFENHTMLHRERFTQAQNAMVAPPINPPLPPEPSGPAGTSSNGGASASQASSSTQGSR